jgi:hypothetical protein
MLQGAGKVEARTSGGIGAPRASSGPVAGGLLSVTVTSGTIGFVGPTGEVKKIKKLWNLLPGVQH